MLSTCCSLVERLCRSAARAAEAEAIVHGGERVTYGELWHRVQGIAAFFMERGLGRNERVALLLENSAAYVAAYYGVLAAGGVVVALNTASKAPDIIRWLAHCGARWIVLDRDHPEAVAVRDGCRDRVAVVTVNEAGGSTGWWEGANPTRYGTAEVVSVAADDLATIIYTSGTTAQPKGVMLSHGNLASNVDSILEYLKLDAADRIVNVLPFYYSYGNSVLHTHLAAGGCVVIENSLVYPHKVVERLCSERATGFAGVPSTFALLLSRVKLDSYDLSGLRYVTQAGGPMPSANIQKLRQSLPHARLFVMYGQTEATARLTYLPPERLQEKLGSVGIPVPGVMLEVRGESGEPLPANQTGEIWVRGGNVMQGYWGDPGLTRKVLVNGWLHTGDMGYKDADGFLYIQGRRSDMIKSGAHRIHPLEIEEAIAAHSGVAEVAVVGVPDEILGEVVKAYVVPRLGAEVNEMQVKAHCRERLAAYKIPRHIEFVDDLPRTASGKVKKFMLAAAS